MQVRSKARPLEAKLVVGAIPTVSDISTDTIMAANGIVGAEETTLLDDITFSTSKGGVRPVWGSEMVELVDDTHGDDICIFDPIGDEYGAYDDFRSECDHSLDEVPLLTPCLKWSRRERVSYAIRLSHAISVSVAFDVHVVPTSSWVKDCEGTWWVIQAFDVTKPIPKNIKMNLGWHNMNYTFAGWA
jgi:hypothetical protein